MIQGPVIKRPAAFSNVLGSLANFGALQTLNAVGDVGDLAVAWLGGAGGTLLPYSIVTNI